MGSAAVQGLHILIRYEQRTLLYRGCGLVYRLDQIIIN